MLSSKGYLPLNKGCLSCELDRGGIFLRLYQYMEEVCDIELIIFDVYGTLISTGTGSLDAVKKILALQEKEINPEDFYKEWKQRHHINMDNANAKIFVNEETIFKLDLEQLYLKYDICRDFNQDVNIMLDTLGKRQCFDETLSSIENLRKKYKVVIGSTTDNAPLYQDMERNGLAVDRVYTSEIIHKYKPDPEFYHYILRKEKCSEEEAIFVGDSYVDDVCGPNQVGIKSILIDRKHKFYCEENKIKPWKITDSLENVIDLVSELGRREF